MSERFFLKPAEGRRVRDPQSMRLLSPDGEYKPQNAYWTRRVLDGDAIVSLPMLQVAPTPQEPKPKARKETKPASSNAQESKE